METLFTTVFVGGELIDKGVAQSILYATPMLVWNKRIKYVAICGKKGVWHNVYFVPHLFLL